MDAPDHDEDDGRTRANQIRDQHLNMLEARRKEMERAKRNPLEDYSLRGDAAKLHAKAMDTVPLLGGIIFQGQATIIYAQPNAGKTLTIMRLIQDAIDEERLDPHKLFYINADDSGKGLAEKVEILEQLDAHMLAPGLKKFKASQFVEKLVAATQNDSARGTVVIIDTLKKFASLMDKGQASSFANVCREYVMSGGTIVALGHTAKNRNADGSVRYQGTTDILEDFDAAYIAEPMNGSAGSYEKIIRFTKEKSRADSPQIAAYAYSTREGLSYAEKLESVRMVEPSELENLDLLEQVDDQEAIRLISAFLEQGKGDLGQDKIARELAREGDVSRAQIQRVLSQYTGTDHAKHLWNFNKGPRGKRSYYLLETVPGDASAEPHP